MANQKRILEPSCPFLFSLISSHTLSQICISLFFHDHFCHCIFCFPRAICIACSIFNEYTRLGSGTWCIFEVFFALLSKKVFDVSNPTILLLPPSCFITVLPGICFFVYIVYINTDYCGVFYQFLGDSTSARFVKGSNTAKLLFHLR